MSSLTEYQFWWMYDKRSAESNKLTIQQILKLVELVGLVGLVGLTSSDPKGK